MQLSLACRIAQILLARLPNMPTITAFHHALLFEIDLFRVFCMTTPQDKGFNVTNSSLASLQELRPVWIERLHRAGVYNPEADVRRIVERVLTAEEPALATRIDPAAQLEIETMIGRREQREPLIRIFGGVEFHGLPIKTHDGVFAPYPETEVLIEPVLEHFNRKTQPLRVLDMGTGSGCLLLAILKEYPAASGLGIDRDGAAVAAAEQNAALLGFSGRATFGVSDWGKGVRETFDLVISNPPRVPSGLVPRLLPEMRDHDPRMAYDGGPDGLDFFRRLADNFSEWCIPDGCGVFQVSDADAVCRIFERRGHRRITVNQNYMGIPSSVSVIRD